jgi:[ribosomal protein S5]-alanine N-acetyltransferase
MKNPFRIGTKIYLRPLEREDAPLLIPWLNDQEVTQMLAIHRPINLQSEEEFIAKVYQSEHDLVLGIAVRQNDSLIGVSGLHQIDFKNRHANFGISIGEKGEWGKGYGTEATFLMVQYAFDTLNLNRVRLLVFESNTRGIRAYEKVGFKQEGVLRQDRFHDGRYWDTITMAILQQDWETAKQAMFNRG